MLVAVLKIHSAKTKQCCSVYSLSCNPSTGYHSTPESATNSKLSVTLSSPTLHQAAYNSDPLTYTNYIPTRLLHSSSYMQEISQYLTQNNNKKNHL